MTAFPSRRGRRLRMSSALRRQFAETRLDAAQFVLPVFVVPGTGVSRPISSMPGNNQMSVDIVAEVARRAQDVGVGGIMFFGIPETKDAEGTSGWDPNGPVPRALEAVAAAAPELVRWADVCLCEYTDHGHCGIVVDGIVENDATLGLLSKAAVAYANAGAQVVTPSDMMDGRVTAIRGNLDRADHQNVAICVHAVKYASSYYGPFRDAVDSSLQSGDRRSHQMNPPNRREARVEVLEDVAEGADIVMVKPAGPYQDIIRQTRDIVDVPVAAYQVSGEFAMIKAAAANGWIDGEQVMLESLTGIVRAGADVIATYFAIDAAEALQ
ncbi:MAG: porphobilinogen synthase [Actinobacteria bacterium]|nr:porphobilinogen synthase [Actinomycetota bacterium]